MKLPTFDKKADVPAAFADLYEEKDGKWVPKADDDGDDLAADLADEKAKREAAEKNAIKTANELKKLERKLAQKDHNVPDDVMEKVRADIRKELDEEYAPKLTAAETLATENRTLKLDDRGKALAAKHGKFLPDKLNDYWTLHGREFDLNDKGEIIVKGKGTAEVEKTIAAHAKARQEWVQGTGAGGGGALGGAGGGATTGLTFEDLMKPGGPQAAVAAANQKG